MCVATRVFRLITQQNSRLRENCLTYILKWIIKQTYVNDICLGSTLFYHNESEFMLSFKNTSLALIAPGKLVRMNLYEKKNKISRGRLFY